MRGIKARKALGIGTGKLRVNRAAVRDDTVGSLRIVRDDAEKSGHTL